MKFRLLTIIFLIFQLSASAQVEDSVKTAVNNLFQAMKNADSVALVPCFSADAILQTIAVRKTETSVENETVSSFASFLNSQETGWLDERIKFESIKIDGDLASVWTPYQFYYKGSFSHCGVNSFQLVRINNIWKIQYLIDTRRKTDCK
jgi:hypothetical protein